MQNRTTLLISSVISFLALPCECQFGIAKKRGTSFEEVNEAAKGEFDEVGIDALGNLMGDGGIDALGNLMGDGGIDALGNLMGDGLGDVSKLFGDMMNDPELVKLLESVNKEGGDILDKLKNMKPDEFASQMNDALNYLTSDDMLSSILDNKEEVLKNLETSGVIDKSAIEQLTKDPEKLESDMKTAFSQIQNMFKDPETLKTVTDIAQDITDVLQNPDKLSGAMETLYSTLMKDVNDDDKIEEARQQLLSNPELAGNPTLASVYGSDEMKEILNDPVKWRETVKKGQGMLLNRNRGAAAMEA